MYGPYAANGGCFSVTTVLGLDVSSFNALCGGVDAHTRVSPCYAYPVHMYEPHWCGPPVRLPVALRKTAARRPDRVDRCRC
jgi:hypothetical protein